MVKEEAEVEIGERVFPNVKEEGRMADRPRRERSTH